MEHVEERRINPVRISTSIPEEHLILMFPFTYVEYRILMSSEESFGTMFTPENRAEGSEKTQYSQSFQSFLSFMGPVPEDTKRAH